MTEEQKKFVRNRIRYWDLRESDLAGWVEHVMARVERGADFEIVAREICKDEIAGLFYMVLLHVAIERGLTVEDNKIRKAAYELRKNETTKPQDDYWGVCPTCLTGRMCYIDHVNWMFCETHRVMWCISERRNESEDVSRANYELLKDFRVIEPHLSWPRRGIAVFGPCSCERCIAPVLEALAAEGQPEKPV